MTDIKKPRIAFFGTPWIAKKCLETLIKLDIELVAIVCQPDRQKDRKNNFIYCDAKNFALDNKIKLYQPEKIKDLYEELNTLNLDLIITCAFGQFIPENILDLPTYKCVNVHASLLPKLRGGAPIHWAIINQEKSTGITLMYMAKKMDAGNIIVQSSINIDKKETFDSLLIKLAQLAQTVLFENTLKLCNHNVVSIPQDEQKITFGYNINSVDEVISFANDSNSIDAKIRGLYSKPMAKLIYENNIYKIHSASISSNKSNTKPGIINKIDKTGIYISTEDYDVIITKIQAPNKNAISISEMINGKHPFVVGKSVE